MQKIFNQILIPVSLPDLDRKAVEKAAGFANQMGCHLHIVCIAPSVPFLKIPFDFLPFNSRISVTKAEDKVAEMEKSCMNLMAGGLKLMISYTGNDVQIALQKYFDANNIDLILICKKISPRCPLNSIKKAGDLSSSINCPVLFSPGLLQLTDIKKIVLPVDEYLPVNKIRIAIYLASQFNAVIHLLAIRNNKLKEGDRDYLKRAYVVLKENTTQPFVCQTINQKDLSLAAVEYAYEIKAGMVLAKPVIPKKISSFLDPLLKIFSAKRKEVAIMAVN